MRYFIEIAYKGTQYAGWQVQKNKPTIQGILNAALSTILNSSISCIGAGRTDSGVHCLQTFAHFDTADFVPVDFIPRMNKLIPKDIAVKNIYTVHPEAHARFDAISRSYEYHIHFEKDPMKQDLSFLFPFPPLDIEAMKKATNLLTTFEDYKSLSKLNKDLKTTLCKIHNAHWETKQGGTDLIFYISANRFLRNMVRRIVGAMLMIGKGKISIEEFKQVMELKKSFRINISVPPQGLYLTEVKYPFIQNKNT